MGNLDFRLDFCNMACDWSISHLQFKMAAAGNSVHLDFVMTDKTFMFCRINVIKRFTNKE